MPFQKPSAGGSVFECEDGRYLLRVDSLEDMPDGEFGPGIKWVLNVADATTKEFLLDDRGFKAELWQFSSAKLTPRAKGRKWVEAFLGRPLDEENDDGDQIMEALLGKWAVAILAHNDKDRVAIVTVSPTKTGTPAPKTQDPATRQPVGAGATRAPTRPMTPPEGPPDDMLPEGPYDDLP